MCLNQYTNEELAEIHLYFGLAGRNCEFAQGLYKDRFPSRRLPNVEIFKEVHTNLCKYGSFSAPQVVGASILNNQRRLEYCNWFKSFCTKSANDILFTDEREFKGGKNNRFTLNIWCGLIAEHLIGPFILPSPLKGQDYLKFLLEDLPPMLRELPDQKQQTMWFMHDGAPQHSYRPVQDLLNGRYPKRWIGKGGEVSWPPSSADLNPIDFYVWEEIKEKMAKCPTCKTRDELKNQINTIFDKFRSNSTHFANISFHLDLRVEMCLKANGGAFSSNIREFFRPHAPGN